MKRVCMFVWNHFTNDARVLRECTTLSENGYDVDLICIDDPDDPSIKKFEEVNPHFRVYRMKRYPTIIFFLKTVSLHISKNKWTIIPSLILWLVLFYFVPWLTILLTILTLLLLITKFRTLIIRGSLILRMIMKGYFKNYDIYHSNDLNTLPQGYVCAKWRINKKRLIYDSHEVQTSRTGYESPWYKRLERFLIKRMDSMFVENHTRAKFNEHLYGIYPNVLHNYPSLRLQQVEEKMDLHDMLKLPSDEKILLYQGGIQMGRGLENLIDAYPYFNEGTLVFIGDGKIKEKLQQMVIDKGLEEHIYFIPKVPVGLLPSYTKSAYLGFQVLQNICFNHWSASSNKLFEYIMCEIPVVACNFPEIKKVVEENEVGVTINPHDPNEIAKGVNELLSNRIKYEYFSMNCKKARNKYNWELEQNNLLEVYQLY